MEMKIDLTKNHILSNLNPKPDKMVEIWWQPYMWRASPNVIDKINNAVVPTPHPPPKKFKNTFRK